MSGDIIKFPSADVPKVAAHPWDCHAQAFRNLEGEICDCMRMAGIAAQLTSNEDDSAPFAIFHVYEMLRRLKQEYYEAYEGDSAAIGRHSLFKNDE
jgi:hypothetical protein